MIEATTYIYEHPNDIQLTKRWPEQYMNHVTVFPTSMPQQVSHVTSRVSTSHHACSFWPWRQSPCALEKVSRQPRPSQPRRIWMKADQVSEMLTIFSKWLVLVWLVWLFLEKLWGPSSAMTFFPCQTVGWCWCPSSWDIPLDHVVVSNHPIFLYFLLDDCYLGCSSPISGC